MSLSTSSCKKCNPTFPSLGTARSANLTTRLRANQHLSASEAIQLSQALSEAEQDLKRYSDEITRLHAVAMSMENQRTELERHVERYKSLLSPVRRLPQDVLLEIFSYHCRGADITREEIYIPAHQLGLVCTYWREITLCSKILWSKFFVDVGDEHIWNFVTGMKLLIERSAPMPMDVSLSWEDEPDSETQIPILSAIVQQSHRWGRLQLHGQSDPSAFLSGANFASVKGNLPLLQVLEFVGSSTSFFDGPRIEIFSVAPKLRSLEFMSHPSVDIADKLSLPWEQLTRMEDQIYDGISASLEVQRACPSLTRMHFLLEPTTFDDYGGDPITTALQTLFLNIDPDGDHDPPSINVTNAVFRNLTVPSLESLSVASRVGCYDGDWPQQEILSFLSRSACALTSLSLKHVPIKEAHLISLLHLLPSLTGLAIHELKDTQRADRLVDDALLKSMRPFTGSCFGAASACLVPKLTHLELSVWGVSFDDQLFTKTIQSRWIVAADSVESDVACLRCVVLRVNDRKFHPPSLAVLDSLDRAGMMITVRDKGRQAKI